MNWLRFSNPIQTRSVECDQIRSAIKNLSKQLVAMGAMPPEVRRTRTWREARAGYEGAVAQQWGRLRELGGCRA